MRKLALVLLVVTIVSPVLAGQGSAPSKQPEAVHAGHGAAVAPGAGFEAAPKGAKVFFANLKNKQAVAKRFLVKFGLAGMKILPAGELRAGTGHHHLIIDGAAIPSGRVVPTDENHLHFGKGQDQAEIKLAPGPHKLTLQFANGAHLSYGPEMSETIDIVVTDKEY